LRTSESADEPLARTCRTAHPRSGGTLRAMWPIVITVVVIVPLLAIAWWRVRR
jgi:hypothetical protein